VTAPLRIVTFTTLYPNEAQPTHGVFVENRLRHLVGDGRVESRVVAPVPWFPRGLAGQSEAYGHFAQVPAREERKGLAVLHPRFLVVPKFGMTIAPLLLFARSLPVLRRLQAEQDFDLIDAHYFYPDGVAAVLLGKALGKPVVITARGTDINLIPRYKLARRWILYAARAAAGIITVAQALKDDLVALGVDERRVRVLRNGVDLAMFRPLDRTALRARLGLDGPTLASVGGLIERKGHDLVIAALRSLPRHTLLIVGEGPERRALERFAVEQGVAERVRFLGRVAHDRLGEIYSAADALVLASSREGWPNVLLEAMACGTPVVATNIYGCPEVVRRPEAGVIVPQRTPESIAAGITRLMERPPDRRETRCYAEEFGWNETSEGQFRLFTEVLAAMPPAVAAVVNG
jgi:teichuronic acid biosynthesis glycosyltransferase TuaC